jgi:ABC-2 type transport system ATP-binding protein
MIHTQGLTKRYGEITALDRVDLQVSPGSVYGLVGPNGAGKTTLLGILAGLKKATDGSTDIGGRSIGVLPDTPQFDRWLTGREVVDLARTLTDPEIPASRVDDVLNTAGLDEDAGRQVRGYSRGMLQRLGLASVVVSEPEVLLLDEPAAALDPAGRREVLNLIAEMRGRSTVIMSSHILDDVQEVCDEIGILRRGEIVYQGSVDGLLGRYVGNSFAVEVRSSSDGVVDLLLDEPWVKTVDVGPDGRLAIAVSDIEAAEMRLVAVLAESGVPVVSMTRHTTSLEDVFLEVTR